MSISNQAGNQVVNRPLDEEWISLIFAAREQGLTIDEIKLFLAKSSKSTNLLVESDKNLLHHGDKPDFQLPPEIRTKALG
jgi:DNA-binding transcriptional MerR regulator